MSHSFTHSHTPHSHTHTYTPTPLLMHLSLVHNMTLAERFRNMLGQFDLLMLVLHWNGLDSSPASM